MHLVRIKTNNETYFVSCEQISHFCFNVKDGKTYIKLCDGTMIETDGNLVNKLAKLVISTTNMRDGSLLSLE